MKNAFISAFWLSIFCSGVYAGNDRCPFPEIYVETDRSYHECANGQKGASCELFLKKLEQILPRYDCKRSFDTSPVPAIWLFGAASKDYIVLLYELASGANPMYSSNWFADVSASARVIFLSKEFRTVLDGAMAEEYYPLIEKVREEQ